VNPTRLLQRLRSQLKRPTEKRFKWWSPRARAKRKLAQFQKITMNFRRKNSPMASGDDLFLVTCAHGEVAVARARMDAPVYPARNAALHAHTLPNHERT
jgi:hypothetical protein